MFGLFYSLVTPTNAERWIVNIRSEERKEGSDDHMKTAEELERVDWISLRHPERTAAALRAALAEA